MLINCDLKELPIQKSIKNSKDLRAAFISAISSFAETAFQNNQLEYLESGNILFIFKMAEVTSKGAKFSEPVILYGLIEKRKKKSDKDVKKFLSRAQLILEQFIFKFNHKDFTELNQFESFKDELRSYFLKKQESLI